MNTPIIKKNYLKPSKLFYIDHSLYKAMINTTLRPNIR